MSRLIPNGVVIGEWLNRDHVAISLGGENIDRWVEVAGFGWKHPKLTFLFCYEEAAAFAVRAQQGSPLVIIHKNEVMFDGAVKHITQGHVHGRPRQRIYGQDRRTP